MKVYIAGPMTGKENYNFEAFEKAREAWSNHEVWTPFDSNDLVWQRHFGKDFDPFTDKCDYGDPLIAEMIGENLKALASCDGIALLPGWQDSRGSKLEIHLAKLLRLPIHDALTGGLTAANLTVHAF